jgi:para-nitrobenzyl esterase
MPVIHPDQSEDCLVLNVWTPAIGGAGKRPVLFRIHGGGFSIGMGNWIWHDGTNLALRGDVVVVTVNHRLNALGYLYLGELGGAEFGEGNPGMLDLVLALEWVRDNIAEFGGDPHNVMIFGESGGGAKISTLLAMPAAQGLFHRAVIESGAMLKATTRETAAAYASAFVDKLGISRREANKLQAVPIETLLDAQFELGGGQLLASPGPCIDGVTLLDHPAAALRSGVSARIPLLIGSCLTEGSLLHDQILTQIFAIDEAELVRRLEEVFGKDAEKIHKHYRDEWPQASPGKLFLLIEAGGGFRRAAIEFAEAKLQGGSSPVFMYLLEWASGARDGMVMASHGLDVPLTMDNTERSGAWTADFPESRLLASTMSEAWLAFARSGNPNHDGLCHWEPYTVDRRATMLFDVRSRVVNDPYEEARFWHGQAESPVIFPWR